VSLRQQLIENNYLVIDDFITEEKAKELYNYFKDEAQKNPKAFCQDEQCPKSLSMYNFRSFLELLIEKIPYISEVIEEPVFPTYSYARIYANGEVLKKHTDRHACEISVTLHLGNDNTDWPIYFTKPSGEQISYNLKPGQAVIYLGMISEHWRDAFQGQEYGQVFLHYVRGRAENWVCYFDRARKEYN
jgi:hypothetical protein